MVDICCIGHITMDKVITPAGVTFMSGGTSFYFSNAICHMDLRYNLITALAVSEMKVVDALKEKGIKIQVLPSRHTVYFENTYPENPDYRTQRVLQKADPFEENHFNGIEASIFHLGPLLADDIPVGLIKTLAAKGKVSLDVQGYLREVRGENVFAIDWKDKKEALQYVSILKANEHEMSKITGQTDVYKAAKILAEWGVKEVVITLGSMGSVIYFEGQFHEIPAYTPSSVVDVTGSGDTYMAGYLYQRVKGAPVREAGEFGAAMATLKIGSSGPFTGNKDDVLGLLSFNRQAV
jgi:sugar/nucleoside kinase (ribokinase family)